MNTMAHRMADIERPATRMVRFLFASILFVAAATMGREATAQTNPIPRIEAAEGVFSEGLTAFDTSNFGLAFRRFQIVIDQYPFNRKTTAAWLMAGKSLYRNGAFRRATDFLSQFLNTYPTSGYLAEARRVRDFARTRLNERNRPIVKLGILLPAESQDLSRTQSLFNGIRLAVDDHNSAAGVDEAEIEMIFRNTRNEPEHAAQMVADLTNAGADMILGPLYSDEAIAAAEAAEKAGVVLVAPLATDEEVSDGHRFVFQTNPTLVMRGRLMARFAVQGLRLHEFGVVAELHDSVSERMAEGFEDEALRIDGDVRFFDLIESLREWYTVANSLGADSLREVEAVYLPVTPGDNPVQLMDGILTGLERIGVRTRVLGGKSWNNLPIVDRASIFQVTYTNDFLVDDSLQNVKVFKAQFAELAGHAPDRLAFTGYDVARFLIDAKIAHPEESFRQVLSGAARYQGLGMRIDFAGGNVNQALFYHRYRDGELQLIR